MQILKAGRLRALEHRMQVNMEKVMSTWFCIGLGVVIIM